LATSCKKEVVNLAVLTTVPVYGITRSSVESGGAINSDGNGIITGLGVCWSETPNPTTANHFSPGMGSYSFSGSLTGLQYHVTYYVRAYAINSAGTAYGDQVSFTTTADTFAIAQNYGGGYIFYLDSTRHHGLTAAPYDLGKVTWGDPAVEIGATSARVGTGYANTQLIVTKLGQGNYAAYLCDQLEFLGYSDWFLPSKDELELMRNNLYLPGYGNFNGSNHYWSSTESSITNAWLIQFWQNDKVDWNKSNKTYYVRAARAF
ncbi:MAG: DUF1566 domain-containing protein, partial [Mariniphaga sp.]